MRRLVLLVACLVLTSCGTFRKVFKAKESHSVKAEQSSTSNSTIDKVDRSITTIAERIDTTIVMPPREVVGHVSFNMDSLVNGLTAIKHELIDVTLHLNPVTGVLTANAKIKPVLVPVVLDKTTVKQNDIVEKINKHDEANIKVATKDKASAIQKEPVKMGIWLIGFAIVIFVISAFIYWLKKR